ncbi:MULTISPECIES: AAA family ATPase [unclassified Acinetobacter]|uniref:AAA family ATPase n=1 Tax=unclassified Acinetobacter TaxID=196816 RepID=UPI0015D3FB61|nr:MULTISPECIES: AAA family ATPase [unclassified Acinetobacter]UUS58411.1 AAA family ATPase [Acinetobacter sp. YH16040_T]
MLVGVFLRHFKIYKGARYIPFGLDELENFNLFIGQNGAGKSSILESLDCFFNNNEFIVHFSEKKNEAFVAPTFLIKKEDLNKFDRQVQKIIPVISELLFDLDQSKSTNYGSYNDFFKQRENFFKYRNTHYLITYAFFPYPEKDTNNLFLTFDSYIKKGIKESQLLKDDKEQNKVLATLKNDLIKNYSFQYIPVETSLNDFLRLESKGMQELMSENVKKRIEQTLTSKLQIKAERTVNKSILDLLNSDLESFVGEVQQTIKQIDSDYSFAREYKSKSNLTANHLTDIIIETFFDKRRLKIDRKPIEHLSAGERKKALIDIAYAFLTQERDTTQNIILAIDEPEASLHISMCYGQFSRLHELAKKYNVQMLISTHWYGALPILDKGNLHHIHEIKSSVNISQYSFKNYFQENGSHPDDIHFKSFFDLVSSIVSSLRLHNKSWLIVEGEEDKKYILNYLDEDKKNDLIVLPVGGCGIVLNLYNYLYAPLSQKSEIKEINRKVVCLVDTDFNALPLEDNFSSETKKKDLIIRRLQIEGDTINLCRLENLNRSPTEIEESLNAKTFYKALSQAIESIGNDRIKLVFSNFQFDETKKFSFIKGDNSIIYPKREFELEGNPSNYKLEIFNFVDKNKELICNIYCELESETKPKWIEDLEKML